MNKSYCSLIVLTFIITGLWDLSLQFITHNYEKMPEFIKWFDFIESLKPYFKQHTILSAILLAAFVGAIAQETSATRLTATQQRIYPPQPAEALPQSLPQKAITLALKGPLSLFLRSGE